MTAESLSRMRASARLPCRTPEPETVDLTPRSAEGSPTITRRHVAASAIRRVIACRISPCVAHRVAVCARAPQGRTPEQKTDGPTDLDRPKRSDDHACRPTWRDRARLRRQTFADHFIVSTISYHLFFASTTSHHHTTTCEPIATRHFARRALLCNHARRPREGRARPYSRFRLVTQSCHSTFSVCTHLHSRRRARIMCFHHAVFALIKTRRHSTHTTQTHLNHTLERQLTPTRAPLGKHHIQTINPSHSTITSRHDADHRVSHLAKSTTARHRTVVVSIPTHRRITPHHTSSIVATLPGTTTPARAHFKPTTIPTPPPTHAPTTAPKPNSTPKPTALTSPCRRPDRRPRRRPSNAPPRRRPSRRPTTTAQTAPTPLPTAAPTPVPTTVP
jgi:hypothetical protein